MIWNIWEAHYFSYRVHLLMIMDLGCSFDLLYLSICRFVALCRCLSIWVSFVTVTVMSCLPCHANLNLVDVFCHNMLVITMFVISCALVVLIVLRCPGSQAIHTISGYTYAYATPPSPNAVWYLMTRPTKQSTLKLKI
ncbi:hypothetical protein BDV19DRAFT_51619 [Aspergillus venezuelensis]